MRNWSDVPRTNLAIIAGIFAGAAVLYGTLWMYAVRNPGPNVEFGFNHFHDPRYDPVTKSVYVEDVIAGSPAEKAGLRAGDRIIGIDGKPLNAQLAYNEFYLRGRPGDAVTVTVDRPGEAAPLALYGVFRAKERGLNVAAHESFAKSSALEVIGLFPIPFLLVGFVVLFLRLDEPTAWLLALLFCAFICAPDLILSSGISPALRIFMLVFRTIFLGVLGPVFYLFFAEFPLRAPLERKIPWLKWVGLAFSAVIILPGLRMGHPSLPSVVVEWTSATSADLTISVVLYALFALGIFSLAQNSFLASVPQEARRKSRIILFGTVTGVLPIVIERVAVDFAGYHPPFWTDTALVAILFLYPLSFAYAVVKHRVMEIPALLRRSARYVLVQRGFFVLLFGAAAVTIATFTRVFSRFFEAGSNAGMMLGAAFGIAIVWVSAPFVKRGTQSIDRSFFRSAYDARLILEGLVEKTRTVTERAELAELIEKQVRGALHPKSLACYLDDGNGNLVAESKSFEKGTGSQPRPKFPFRFGARFVLQEADSIPATMPLLSDLARSGKAWDVPPAIVTDREELATPDPLAAECLVPILGRTGGLIGLIALGQRQSEEPYSGEDKHLLDSVAAQAGITLESILMARKMAERLEAERRVAREMEIAREVQVRLFPQKLPAMKTLEYRGGCIPAREVGGDYYDFLQLPGGHLGLVLADIAGKGVSGALLMANLQANLRSQCATNAEDLSRLLTTVNHSFCENTGDASYATLFFADYDDANRRLRYANCGHLPPLLLSGKSEGRNGEASVTRLDATSMVVGLFDDWKCEVAERELAPGDVLVLYTDGITEAMNAGGEEFGETRLVETLKQCGDLPVDVLMQEVVRAVQRFTGGEQQDDITLVVARSLG